MTERLDFLMVMIDKITAPAKRASGGLRGIKKQLDAIQRGNKGFALFEETAKRSAVSVNRLGRSGDRLISLSANLSLASSSARMLSQQLTGMLLSPIQEAAEFEQSMSKVRAVTDDFTDSQTELARVLGRDTKFTANEAAQGMANLAIAGFSAQEQMDSLAGVLSLDAAAGMGDLGQTAEIAAGVLKGFGLEASKMTDVGDILTRTFTSSATTLTDLGQTLSFVAPIAKVAGVSLKETAILAGVLGDANIRGTRAGTGLRLILSQLAGTSPKATKALKSLGIQTQDAAGNLLPVTGILKDLSKEFSKLGTAKQVQLATKLFGRVGATPGAQLLNDLAKTTGSFDKVRAALDNTGKTAKSVAEIMQDNLAEDVIKVESAVSSLKITIGNVFTPELRQLAKVLKDDVLPPLEQWVKDNNGLVKVLGGLTAMVAGITAALAALGAAVGSVALLMGFVAKGAAAITTAWAGLSAAAFQLGGVLQVVWAGIQVGAAAAAGVAVTAFKGMVAAIGGSLAALGGLVILATAGWTLAIVTWWSDIKLLVAEIPSSFLELGADMAQGLIDGWDAIFGRFDIADDIARLVFKIEDFLGIASPSKLMMGIGDNMAQGLNQGMNGGMNANAPSRFAGAAAGSMAGGGAGGRAVMMKPTINVTVNGGGGAAEGQSVGDSIENTLRKVFDDFGAALGAS